MGRYHEALTLNNEVANVPKSIRFRQSLELNYSETLMLTGNLLESKMILENLIGKIDKVKNADVYVAFIHLISTLYEKQGKMTMLYSELIFFAIV